MCPSCFVEHEFTRYIRCEMLAWGFSRLLGPACGVESIVAFSCKGRICPSCWARPTADTAAHLVDRVFPEARCHINADIHIRIFSDRVKVESPGAFPRDVTVANLREVGSKPRNPLIVDHVREFPERPNLDAGEGVKMTFETMHCGFVV